MKNWLFEKGLILDYDTLLIGVLAGLLINLLVGLYHYWKEKENQRKYFDREL